MRGLTKNGVKIAEYAGGSINPAGAEITLQKAYDNLSCRASAGGSTPANPPAVTTTCDLTCTGNDLLLAKNYYESIGPHAGHYTITPIRATRVDGTHCDINYSYRAIGPAPDGLPYIGSDYRRFTYSEGCNKTATGISDVTMVQDPGVMTGNGTIVPSRCAATLRDLIAVKGWGFEDSRTLDGCGGCDKLEYSSSGLTKNGSQLSPYYSTIYPDSTTYILQKAYDNLNCI